MTRQVVHRLFALLLLVCACTGTDTGNPPRVLVDFDDTSCKSKSPSASSSALWRATLDASKLDSAPYAGLSCFVWRKAGQDVRIGYTNYVNGCGEDEMWKPRAELRDDGGLDLALEEGPTCANARCGSCLYDLSFTVRVPEAAKDLPVRLYHDECGTPDNEVRASLSLGAADAGARCAYTAFGALIWHAGEAQQFGTLRMPCRGIGIDQGDSAPSCDEGLACTAIAADDQRCLPTCAKDPDCALPELTRCVAGVCELRRE